MLGSFYSVGAITTQVYDSLRSAELEISPPEQVLGKAPYFTETVRQYIYKTFGEDVLYSGGLKIFTSLDATLQVAAEKAIAKKIDFNSDSAIQEAVRAAESALNDKGRVLLRASGTEPLIRVMVEGEDAVLVNKLASEIAGCVTLSASN